METFPFLVTPVGVSGTSNKSPIDKYSWHSSLTSHLVKCILKLVSISKHVQSHRFVVHVHVVKSFFAMLQ